MRPEAAQELLIDWFPNLTTRALKKLIRMLRSKDPRLIRHAYRDDDDNGCLAEHAGRCHPELAGRQQPGIDFLDVILPGGHSFVVEEWDRGSPNFARELLRMLRNELSLRTARLDDAGELAEFGGCSQPPADTGRRPGHVCDRVALGGGRRGDPGDTAAPRQAGQADREADLRPEDDPIARDGDELCATATDYASAI